MTLAELQTLLNELPPNGEISIDYGTFAELFPPGIRDVHASNAAFHFAKTNGCTITNRPSDQALCFVKGKEKKTARELTDLIVNQMSVSEGLQIDILSDGVGWYAVLRSSRVARGQSEVNQIVRQLRAIYDLSD